MIRPSPQNFSGPVRYSIHVAAFVVLISLIAGCAVPPLKPSLPTAEETTKQQRLERAQTNLNDGLKKYDSGGFDEAFQNFLLALDSGQLTLAEQLTARKHMAFIHCLSGREANCKEEFEKVIALDLKFDLTPAEAGHPTWGPIYRLARTEIELRRSGRALPVPPAKSQSLGEQLKLEGRKAYEDAEYNKAIKSFQDALKEPLTNAEQITAHKMIAFSYCLTNRMTLCRAAFEQIFNLNANFDLEPAEAGHPSWGPSFRAAKAKKNSALPKK